MRDCPDLHGEVATETLVAFARADGVMTVTDDGGWRSSTIDYPGRDGRLWTLAGTRQRCSPWRWTPQPDP